MANFSIYSLIERCLGNAGEENIVDLLTNSKNFASLEEVTVFDVGCYVGRFSQNINTELTKVFNKPIIFYLFDPNEKIKNLLNENIDFSYNYSQLALDNSNTVKDFYLNTNFAPAGSSLQKVVSQDELWKSSRAFVMGKTNKPFQVCQAQTQTLDNFCQENNISKIDILKIDVEGNELNVIQGGLEILKSCSIIYMEVLDRKKTFNEKFAQLKQILSKNDFALCDVKNILSVSILSRIKAVDALFVHKSLLA